VNIYVETNFVLELTFQQEQHYSCEQILALCESKHATLIIPAYSLAEPHEKLIRQAKNRNQLQESLQTELYQLSRTASDEGINIKNRIQDLTSLIVQSNENERNRFIQYRECLFNVAEIIALTTEILREAASYEKTHDLTAQDAFVYASVINHLQRNQPKQACFLNRNFKDFNSPDIVDELKQFNCRMIPRFDHGYNFLESQLLS
jgi:predicted nucleic acid-binding protein